LSHHTTENAVHIYKNDLVGIDQLDKEDRFFPEAPVDSISAKEEEQWTTLVGNIWRLPEDGRLAMRFQKRCLKQPFQNVSRALIIASRTYLHRLAMDERAVPQKENKKSTALSRSNISITDYFGSGLPAANYDIDNTRAPALDNRLECKEACFMFCHNRG